MNPNQASKVFSDLKSKLVSNKKKKDRAYQNSIEMFQRYLKINNLLETLTISFNKELRKHSSLIKDSTFKSCSFKVKYDPIGYGIILYFGNLSVIRFIAEEDGVYWEGPYDGPGSCELNNLVSFPVQEKRLISLAEKTTIKQLKKFMAGILQF